MRSGANGTKRKNRWIATTSVLIAVLLGPSCKQEEQTTQPEPATASEVPAPRLPENATLEQALDFPEAFQRIQRVAQILDQAKPAQLPSIQGAFEAAPLPWGDLEYVLFITWWARFDPNEAMSYCLAELRLKHPRAAAAVLRTWGQTDPLGALTSGWLDARSLESPGLNPEFIDPLVVGWFESGKPGLDAFIQGLKDSPKISALNAYMRMRILRDGSREALEWSIAAPFTPEDQRLLLATALNIVARRDPKLAIEWLAVAKTKGIDTRTFVARIGRGWATSSPRDAMEWVITEELAEPLEFFRAVADIAATWLEKDEEGLHQWLTTQTKDGWTDVVRRQAISYHVTAHDFKVDWPEMISRAAELINEAPRQLMYVWIVQRWKVVQPEAATKWLNENKALLGDQIKFVDQVPADELKRIKKLMAESEGTSEKSKKS